MLLHKSSKWTILSGQLGQLFIQLRFIPPLTKVRGSFFLCWISRIWLLRRFLVRKSGTLRWHMEKTPAYFFCFFCKTIHSYLFLFFDIYYFFLLFIPLLSFRCPKTSQTEHFWVDFFAQKTFPFKFPIWVPSRDPPKMFKMNNFKWTIVYTIALHASTDQSKGLLFCLLDLTNLTPWKVFCQKIWNTKMAYGKNTCKFLLFFLHFYPFLFIPVFWYLLIFSPLHSSASLPGSKK